MPDKPLKIKILDGAGKYNGTEIELTKQYSKKSGEWTISLFDKSVTRGGKFPHAVNFYIYKPEDINDPASHDKASCPEALEKLDLKDKND